MPPVLRAAALTLLMTLPAQAQPETRCGWFVNPTPANMWLTDRAGDWTLSTQSIAGAAPGFDENFNGDFKDQWVETNGSYGYGCACIRADFGVPGSGEVRYVFSGKVLPLAKCVKDPALPSPGG